MFYAARNIENYQQERYKHFGVSSSKSNTVTEITTIN